MTGIYVEDGRAISTHSMIKTFRRCPKQTQYKYVQRLKPKISGRPLTEGTWMHKLLEVHSKGGDWKVQHQILSAKYAGYFDEEKEMLGNLPVDCARLMKSYLWHYEKDPWKIVEVEYTIECELPDGTIYRGRVDLIVENQYGLWIVDHKFNARLPDLSFRLLDAQSALYVWGARQSGIPVEGHIWNYVKRKVPSTPALLKDGSRLSRAKCETDYPTLVLAIKKYGLDPAPYKDWLKRLKNQQYRHGQPQTSPFFRRDVLERKDEMLKQVAREAFHTSKRMNSYPFDRTDFVERVPDRSCSFMCSYTDICTLELMGGNTRMIRKQRFTETDPMYYYHDDPPAVTHGGRGEN